LRSSFSTGWRIVEQLICFACPTVVRRPILLVSGMALLSFSLIFMLQRQKQFVTELSVMKEKLARHSEELKRLRQQSSRRELLHQRIAEKISPVLVNYAQAADRGDASPGLTGLDQLAHAKAEQEQHVLAAESKALGLAAQFGVTLKDLDQRDSPPERLKPFFGSVDDWGNQIRILQTMEMRIKAEVGDSQASSPPSRE
jgi:hypothetical protein